MVHMGFRSVQPQTAQDALIGYRQSREKVLATYLAGNMWIKGTPPQQKEGLTILKIVILFTAEVRHFLMNPECLKVALSRELSGLAMPT